MEIENLELFQKSDKRNYKRNPYIYNKFRLYSVRIGMVGEGDLIVPLPPTQ